MNWKCFLFGHKIVKQKAERQKEIKVPIQASLGTGEEVMFTVSTDFGDKYTDYMLNRCTRCGKWWVDTYVKGSI
jgi:hypothetical protein